MIYLYRFSLYSKPRAGVLVQEWNHTSYETPIEHSAYPDVAFTPLPGLTHAEVRYDGEKNAGQIRITCARDFPVAAMFLAGYPYGSIYLRVIEVESDEPDALARVIWMGRIRNASFDELQATMSGTDGREMLQRAGLRLNGGTACQWDLYGPECGISEAPFTRAGEVLSVSLDGLTVDTSLSAVSNYFKAGKLHARGQARMVLRNVAGELTLMSPIPGLAAGDEIYASRGCDRSTSAVSGCQAFNNINKFSGFDGFATPRNVFAEGA